MKKRSILLAGPLLIPFVSAFINPDARLYSTGELATAIVGNNLFFGGIVFVGLIIVAYYVWIILKKSK